MMMQNMGAMMGAMIGAMAHQASPHRAGSTALQTPMPSPAALASPPQGHHAAMMSVRAASAGVPGQWGGDWGRPWPGARPVSAAEEEARRARTARERAAREACEADERAEREVADRLEGGGVGRGARGGGRGARRRATAFRRTRCQAAGARRPHGRC